MLTFDGVDVMGTRLADEVCDLLPLRVKLVIFFYVAYSLEFIDEYVFGVLEFKLIYQVTNSN